jgi:RNA polymerase sigma factor (sigma-70 family)
MLYRCQFYFLMMRSRYDAWVSGFTLDWNCGGVAALLAKAADVHPISFRRRALIRKDSHMTHLIDELVRGYSQLRRILMHELGADDGADLAQASFERALDYALSHKVESPAGLIFHIARHLQIDQGRRRKRIVWQSMEDHVEDTDSEPRWEVTPEREYAGQQAVSQLCEVLDRLPPRCREAFVLCKVHGMSYHEAAAEMGISFTVVRQYLVHSMRECRAVLLPPKS